MIKWILWDYPKTRKTNVLKLFEKYNNKKIIIIKSNKDLEKFKLIYKLLLKTSQKKEMFFS
ncbi:MAG: hypothetical protein U5L76_05415 [Patescibacteria group bacterium]|nr:hypothetical protein [Patescibacteria group bacterium]